MTKYGTYVEAPVSDKSKEELTKYIVGMGFEAPEIPLHVTIAYSKEHFEYGNSLWNEGWQCSAFPQSLMILGRHGRYSLTLKVDSSILYTAFDKCMAAGASFDYNTYQPHITLVPRIDNLSNLVEKRLTIFDGLIWLDREVVKRINLDTKKLEDIE